MEREQLRRMAPLWRVLHAGEPSHHELPQRLCGRPRKMPTTTAAAKGSGLLCRRLRAAFTAGCATNGRRGLHRAASSNG